MLKKILKPKSRSKGRLEKTAQWGASQLCSLQITISEQIKYDLMDMRHTMYEEQQKCTSFGV
jgi:hypothetical protein